MKRFGTYLLMGTFAGMLMLGVFGSKAEAKEAKIEQGVYIGNMDLSGMTVSEAQKEVSGFVDSLQDKNITLVVSDDREVTVTAAELGLSWAGNQELEKICRVGKQGNIIQRYKALTDLHRTPQIYPLEFTYDEEALDSILEEQSNAFNHRAVNASLSREDGEFRIVEGQTGYKLNVDASKEALKTYLQNEWDYEDASVQLVVEIEQPEGNYENLSKVKDILGTFTTEFKTSGKSRCQNVSNGCAHLNDITLYPGEQLSVLQMITPFSIENGYEMAGSYLNGQVVESLGGGICQVSTTLYGAVLRSELQVDERSNHSMIIAYVDPSQDAAIAESSGKDFKFTNNTEYPIYIEGYTTPDKTITFTIYGVESRPESHSVSYESEILEKTVPENEAIIADGSQPVGYISVQSVHVGYKARLWKITKENGVEVSREQINSSNYKAVPRTATVGTSTTNEGASSQIQAAIASGSIDQCKAVAGAWAAQFAAEAAGQAAAEDSGAGATDG